MRSRVLTRLILMCAWVSNVGFFVESCSSEPPIPFGPLIRIVADSHVLFQWCPEAEPVLDDLQKSANPISPRDQLRKSRYQYIDYIIGDGTTSDAMPKNPAFEMPSVFHYEPAFVSSNAIRSTFELSREARTILQTNEEMKMTWNGTWYSFGSGPGREGMEFPRYTPVLRVNSEGMIYRHGTFFRDQ